MKIEEEIFFKVYRNIYINRKIFSFLSPFKYSSKRYDNISLLECCERQLFNLLKEKLRTETDNDRDYNVLGKSAILKFMFKNSDFQLFKLVYERFIEEFSYTLHLKESLLIKPYKYVCENPGVETIKFLREKCHSICKCDPIRISSWNKYLRVKAIIDNPIKTVPLDSELKEIFIVDTYNKWEKDQIPEVLEYLNQSLPKSTIIYYEGIPGYNDLVSLSKYPRILFNGEPFTTQNIYEYYSKLGNFQAIKFIYENDPERICNPNAFYQAIENGNFEIFKFLFLTKNSDPFLLKLLRYVPDNKHHVSFYKFIIENQNKRNDGEFPLKEYHFEKMTNNACHSSNVELLQYLMDKKVAIVTNRYLIYSVQIIQCFKQSENFNEMELFKYYLKQDYGRAPHLELLIKLKKFEFLKYIISKMDSLEYSAIHFRSYTLLDKSAITGDLEFYKFFNRSGTSKKTINSLIWAVEYNRIDIVKYLVEICQMQVDYDLFRTAVALGYIDIMDYFYGSYGFEFPPKFNNLPPKKEFVSYLISNNIITPSTACIEYLDSNTNIEIIEMIIPYEKPKDICMVIHQNFDKYIKLFKKLYLLAKSTKEPLFNINNDQGNGVQEIKEFIKNMHTYKYIRFLAKYDKEVLYYFKDEIRSNIKTLKHHNIKGAKCFQIFLDMGIVELNTTNIHNLLIHPSYNAMKLFYSNLSIMGPDVYKLLNDLLIENEYLNHFLPNIQSRWQKQQKTYLNKKRLPK